MEMPEESSDIKIGGYGYQAAHRDLVEGIEWLGSLGVPRLDPTRLGSCRRALAAAAEAEANRSMFELLQRSDPRALMETLFEAIEWSGIYRTFGTRSDPLLTKKLRRFVKGPPRQREERTDTSSNTARDIGFELTIAAQLAAGGLEPDFGSEADVSVRIEKTPLLIECKRPQSPARIEDLLKEARHQLRGRYANEPSARGLTAISFSKLLDGAVITAENRLSVQDALETLHRGIIQKYGPLLLSDPKDSRTLGTLLSSSCIGLIRSDRFAGVFGSLSARTQNRPEDDRLVEHLVTIIKKGEYVNRLAGELLPPTNAPAEPPQLVE